MRKDLNMSPGKLAAQVAHCAEAYWLNLIRGWSDEIDILTDSAWMNGYVYGEIWNNYINGAITKTICEARNKNHLMKV